MRLLEPDIRNDVRRVMDASGEALASEITARAPKDTGEMAEAAMHKVSNDGLGVSVGYSSKQSGFKRAWRAHGFASLWAEFGSRGRAATPFIRPAYRALLSGILDNIDAAVSGAIKRAATK